MRCSILCLVHYAVLYKIKCCSFELLNEWGHSNVYMILTLFSENLAIPSPHTGLHNDDLH